MKSDDPRLLTPEECLARLEIRGAELPKFGQRLRVLRAAAGLTQRQLAEVASLPQPSLARIESGGLPNPGWDTVCRLADALNVSVQAFR